MKENTSGQSRLIGGTFGVLFKCTISVLSHVMSLGPLDLSEWEYNTKDTKNPEGNIRHLHTPGGADN